MEKAFWKKSSLLCLLSSVFATFSCTDSAAVVLMRLALGGASAVEESCLNSTQRLSHRPKSLKKSFYTLVNVTWNVDLTKLLSVKVLSKDPKYSSLKQPPWEMCSSKFMLIQTRCLSMAIFIFSAWAQILHGQPNQVQNWHFFWDSNTSASDCNCEISYTALERGKQHWIYDPELN